MIKNAEWLFFDIGSTLIDEHLAYEARIKKNSRSGKYKIGVIANQSLGTKQRLESYGLIKYIDLVVASAEEGVAKPDKRIFETALNRSGCKASDSVMIGDRIDNDSVPANLLGMHTAWIRQGFWRYWNIKNDIEKADYTVNSLSELCEFL